MTTEYRTEVEALSHTLLDDAKDPSTLRPEVMRLVEIFEAVSAGFTRDADTKRGETLTAQGLAISPTMAAVCAEDYMRTIQFLRGFNAAIGAAHAAKAERTVHALYVGTGPYAVLAVPLMTVWAREDCVFELLDLHETSVQSVSAILKGLGLEEHVSAVRCGDAMTYGPDPECTPDIVMAEIMLAGLEKEPQVAVTRSLTRTLPEALFLPETVEISLVTEDGMRSSQPIFTYGAELRRHAPDETRRLPAGSVYLSGRTQPFLETRIVIYGPYTLEPHQSGLTCRRVPLFDNRVGEIVELEYRMGERPGIYRSQ